MRDLRDIIIIKRKEDRKRKFPLLGFEPTPLNFNAVDK
jgi:hypothetical protein